MGAPGPASASAARAAASARPRSTSARSRRSTRRACCAAPTTCRPCPAGRTSPRPTPSPAATATPEALAGQRPFAPGLSRGGLGPQPLLVPDEQRAPTRCGWPRWRPSACSPTSSSSPRCCGPSPARSAGSTPGGSPSLRVPGDCTAGLSPDEAWAAGCYEQVGLTGLGPWALTAGRHRPRRGRALTWACACSSPGGRCASTLRRVAALLVAPGALVALVTLVLPELIVFTRNVLGGSPETGPVAESTGVGSSSDKGGANLGFVATVGGTATLLALVRADRRHPAAGGGHRRPGVRHRHVVDQAVLGRAAAHGQHAPRRPRRARWRSPPGPCSSSTAVRSASGRAPASCCCGASWPCSRS